MFVTKTANFDDDVLHIMKTGDYKSTALDGRVHHVRRRSLHRVVEA